MNHTQGFYHIEEYRLRSKMTDVTNSIGHCGVAIARLSKLMSDTKSQKKYQNMLKKKLELRTREHDSKLEHYQTQRDWNKITNTIDKGRYIEQVIQGAEDKAWGGVQTSSPKTKLQVIADAFRNQSIVIKARIKSELARITGQ